MYQIDGRDVLFEWLGRESDPNRGLLMLEWVAGLATDPFENAQRVPGMRAPVFITIVPLRPSVVVTFLVAEQFRTVKLIKIKPLS